MPWQARLWAKDPELWPATGCGERHRSWVSVGFSMARKLSTSPVDCCGLAPVSNCAAIGLLATGAVTNLRCGADFSQKSTYCASASAGGMPRSQTHVSIATSESRPRVGMSAKFTAVQPPVAISQYSRSDKPRYGILTEPTTHER